MRKLTVTASSRCSLIILIPSLPGYIHLKVFYKPGETGDFVLSSLGKVVSFMVFMNTVKCAPVLIFRTQF